MGAQLPKPVVSKDIERYGNEYFTCAVASMNGYRERMEDSHSVDFHPTYGLFAVFDGHMDPDCSAYFGVQFPLAVAKAKPPLTDEALQDLSVNLDCEYLALQKESGSTGTFLIASIVKGEQDVTFDVQVGNVGDSRVICGRDGKAIPMTIDHKPTLPEERARIIECGGDVVNARVDGNLAVSRAFGDLQYKGGPGGPRKQKVIALPEVTHIKCTKDDFMVLCCDGVFEGSFSNEQVIEFVSQRLQETSDIGLIAAAVCDAALERGSKDNITCMVVLFKDGTGNCHPEREFLPGPFSAPHNTPFCTAYVAMGDKLGIQLGKQLQLRYEYLQRLLHQRTAELQWPANGQVADWTALSEETLRSILKANKEPFDGLPKEELLVKVKEIESSGRPAVPNEIKEIQDELRTFSEEGPPTGDGYAAWFDAEATRLTTAAPGGGAEGSDGATKVMVDASTFSRLIQLQQRTGGQIPLPMLLGLLQANGGQLGDLDADAP
eukprot:TRINITY_DN738_c0_g1_i1.p1 TRINITY_DN738_c0_g1~~TRINITY_DN738_c0_g1_i1.p1  ORF type:complete len:492 (-),score=145.24 TRINITY_DN738_c0_g1_i1:294-1769(-)